MSSNTWPIYWPTAVECWLSVVNERLPGISLIHQPLYVLVECWSGKSQHINWYLTSTQSTLDWYWTNTQLTLKLLAWQLTNQPCFIQVSTDTQDTRPKYRLSVGRHICPFCRPTLPTINIIPFSWYLIYQLNEHDNESRVRSLPDFAISAISINTFALLSDTSISNKATTASRMLLIFVSSNCSENKVKKILQQTQHQVPDREASDSHFTKRYNSVSIRWFKY